METNRRSFVTGLGALLTAATIPGTALALPKSDLDRLRHALKYGGFISDMEFRFHLGETLHITSVTPLTIHNCTFRWFGTAPRPGLRLGENSCVTFTNNLIDLSKCDPLDYFTGVAYRAPYPNHGVSGQFLAYRGHD